MDYLICQDWKNTSGNHAGIKHLCNKLVSKYPDKYKTYCRAYCYPTRIPDNIFSATITKIYFRILNIMYTLQFCIILVFKLKSGDRLFLLEYLMKGGMSQLPIARAIKLIHPKIPIYGMAHLVPARYDAEISEKDFVSWDRSVTKFITLGHSLTDYFISVRGVSKERVITTFHYVDTEYYNSDSYDVHLPIRVIVMGNMQRDYELLKSVVQGNPNVNFWICQGRHDLSCDFDKFSNVKLIPFVTENELRELMRQSDISLNMMKDTIGSNVIVTSMAMGLAMICSNVGSITDYCNDSNSILCDNIHPEEFTEAIMTLCNDRSLLASMKQASSVMATRFSIERFHDELQKSFD